MKFDDWSHEENEKITAMSSKQGLELCQKTDNLKGKDKATF